MVLGSVSKLRVLWLMAGMCLPLLLGASRVQAQQHRPPELNLQYHRAEVAWRSGGSVLEAKARVDRVLSRLPDDVEALKLRAQVLLSLEKPSDAVKDAARAASLHPDDGEAQLILAEACHADGRNEQALSALAEAAELLVDDAGSHVRMSWLAGDLGRLELAEAYGRVALELGERYAPAYYQLARVFVKQGKQDAAAEILARGLQSSILMRAALSEDAVLAPLLSHPQLIDVSR